MRRWVQVPSPRCKSQSGNVVTQHGIPPTRSVGPEPRLPRRLLSVRPPPAQRLADRRHHREQRVEIDAVAARQHEHITHVQPRSTYYSSIQYRTFRVPTAAPGLSGDLVQFGAVFPTTEIGNDPGAIRDYAQTAEALGCVRLTTYDHVLGADHADRDPPLRGPYTQHDPFHEPFVLLGFLAAHTSVIELATGVLVLPQRQTALVAKQAAELDHALARPSGARHRHGVEPCRVHRPGDPVPQPRPSIRRADLRAAGLVAGRSGRHHRRVPPHRTSRLGTTARATDPAVAGGLGRSVARQGGQRR